MSKFTKSFRVELDFEGDHLVLVMERMKRKDALKLVPYMGAPDADGTVNISFGDQITVMNVAADLLPKYVKSLTGLVDEDGEAMTIEMIVDEAYFLTLIGQILNHLMVKSFIGEAEVKKSNAQQENTSETSAPTKPSQ